MEGRLRLRLVDTWFSEGETGAIAPSDEDYAADYHYGRVIAPVARGESVRCPLDRAGRSKDESDLAACQRESFPAMTDEYGAIGGVHSWAPDEGGKASHLDASEGKCAAPAASGRLNTGSRYAQGGLHHRTGSACRRRRRTLRTERDDAVGRSTAGCRKACRSGDVAGDAARDDRDRTDNSEQDAPHFQDVSTIFR